MGNFCSKGDIIVLEHMNLAGYDNEFVLDIRLNGHPYIVLNDVEKEGEYVLCLKCSSSKKGKRKNCHYLIKDFKLRGRPRKDTYVDIKNMYKVKIYNFIEIRGRVSNEILDKLISLTKELSHK